MKISLTLSTNLNKEGERIIQVRVYNDGKYKHYSTGIGCKPSNWNKNSSRVGSRDHNYKEKNKEIEKLLHEVEKRYENNCAPATVKTLKEQTSFFDVLDAKINSMKQTSGGNFKQLKSFLTKHYSTISIESINQEWYDNFIDKVVKLEALSQREKMVKYFNTAYMYGLQSGMITKYQVFKVKDINKVHAHIPNNTKVTSADITKVISAYRIMIRTEQELIIGKNKNIHPIALFCLHLAFQGIARADMARLRVKDITVKELSTIEFDTDKSLNEKDYQEWYDKNNKAYDVVSMQFRRNKTNTLVEVHTMFSIIRPIIQVLTEGKKPNDYLIPCLDSKKEYTEGQIANRIDRYYYQQTIQLNNLMEVLSTKDIVINDNGTQDIVKISKLSKKLVFYDARHGFINMLYYKGVEKHIIQKMVGHNTEVIDKHYIHPISPLEQAMTVAKIFETGTDNRIYKF